MSHVLRAMPDLFRVGFAGIVAYRAEMTIWILSATMPLIMLALWNAVAEGGPVAGFGQVELARYFAVTLVVRQLTSVWLVWEMNYEIRTGRLSTRLLKPMHPMLVSAVEMVTAMPVRLLVLTPLLAALILWRPELVAWPSLPAFLLFGWTLLMAWLLNFLVQALFATLSFWLDKTDGLFGVWFAFYTLLSGYVAPLAMFPAWSEPLLRALPFRGMLALPVELLGGFLSPIDALPDALIQLGWVAALWVGLRVLWRRGLTRYGAYGA